MNNISTNSSCALCDDGDSILLQRGVRHGPDLQVRRCGGCGLVRLDPLPTESALERFYTEAYRAEHEPGMDPAQAHRNEIPEARLRVERLKNILAPDLSLLEIGSSSGAFLDSVRPFVGEAVGVEPANAHRNWAKKQLKLELMEDIEKLGKRRFDRIVLFHVLEHVLRPVEFLKNLLSKLTPVGMIVVEVPNIDDALLALYQTPSFGPFYYQNAHLWYFSKGTLERAAASAGARAKVTGIQRYDLSNHLRWMLTGKPGGLGFYKNLFPKSLDLAYADAMIRAGHSDTLWAVMEQIPGSRKR